MSMGGMSGGGGGAMSGGAPSGGAMSGGGAPSGGGGMSGGGGAPSGGGGGAMGGGGGGGAPSGGYRPQPNMAIGGILGAGMGAPSGGGGGGARAGGGMSGGGGMGANPTVVNSLFGIASSRSGMSSGGGMSGAGGGMGAFPQGRTAGGGGGGGAGGMSSGGMGDGLGWQRAIDAQAAGGSVGQQWYDQQGPKFKERVSADQVKQYASGKGYTLGQAWGGPAPTTAPTAIGDAPTTGGGEAETYDYAAEMEAMLAPLRAQIEALSKPKETQGSSESGISSKPSYSYTPGGSGNEVGSGVNGSPDLFKNWMANQESVNRASTAYMFAPGGTRRQDESKTDATTSGENMKYWNQTDSDLTQTAMNNTQYDEEKEKKATYFSNGQRAAGSVFDAWG